MFVADTWMEKIDAYLDGELPSGEMSAMDQHVRGCSECAAAVLNQVRIKRALQIAGKRYSASPELRQRIQGMAATRPVRRWTWAPIAVFALIILGFFAMLRLQRNSESRTFSEIADLHVSALASANPVEVVSTDRHTVKPWFEGKIPFTFNLPELQNSDFHLAGGRVTYLGQTPGAHLIFQIRRHQISAFIFQDQAVKGLPEDSGIRQESTFEAESWRQSGLRYFVVGDPSAEDIEKLVELLKNAR
jgi:anti-sigma factor RsiW